MLEETAPSKLDLFLCTSGDQSYIQIRRFFCWRVWRTVVGFCLGSRWILGTGCCWLVSVCGCRVQLIFMAPCMLCASALGAHGGAVTGGGAGGGAAMCIDQTALHRKLKEFLIAHITVE